MQKEDSHKKKTYKFLAGFAALLFFVLSSSDAHAALLFINSQKSSIEVGDIVKLRVGVDTQGININNGEAVVSFPTDLIQVIGVDSASSIFDLWVDQPRFSNATGEIVFNGGVANPGFIGTGGTVLWITVKAKKAGSATFSLGSAAVRANDGLGTDVLSSKRGVTVSIVAPKEKPITSEPAKGDTVSPDTLFVAVTKNEKGEMIAVLNAHDNDEVDYFTVVTDSLEIVKLDAVNDSATYLVPRDLSEGKHNAVVTVFDRSGNYKTQTVSINIDSSLPEITYFSKELVVGKYAHVVGVTGMPDTEVVLAVVYPSKRLETYLIMTDENGKFDFVTEALTQVGDYSLWVQKADTEGLDVNSSNRIKITVFPTWIQKQITLAKPLLPLIIGIILGVIMIIVFAGRSGYRLVRVSRRDRDYL